MSFVELSKDGAIATVLLNRPERLNAISTQMTADLHEALVEANEDADIRVLILTGAGRAFCAGDDLKEFEQQIESDAATAAHIEGIQQITRDLMYSEKPVIAAAHGYAVGGGFEWMLNCDLIVAADDLVAFFPETEIGQFPTGGVTHLLPQAVGHCLAMELLLLGERQDATALKELGLVNRVVARDEMLPAAKTMAQTVAGKSAFSVSRLKRLMNRDLSKDLERALDLETRATLAAFKSDEARERSKDFPTRK